jgi:plasmid stabilization system protein ParE
VFQIWTYLADKGGVELADRIESELFERFDLLERNPGLGHERQDLTAFPVLFYRVFPYQYMIIYRQKTPLEIVGVLHGKRDVKGILENRPKS